MFNNGHNRGHAGVGQCRDRKVAAEACQSFDGIWPGVNPNGARALKGKQTGNKEAVAKITANATQRAVNLKDIIEDLRGQGVTSIRAVTAELNARAILTPRRRAWHPTSVARLLDRLGD